MGTIRTKRLGLVVLELFAEDPKTANRLSADAARAHLIERGYPNDIGSPTCIKPGLDHRDFAAPLSFTEVQNVYSGNAPELRGQLSGGRRSNISSVVAAAFGR